MAKNSGRGEESDGGFGLLIGQHLGEGQARVIVHGHMQRQEAGMFLLAPQASIAAQAHLGKARHALDIQVQHVAGPRVLVALYGRRRVQIAPAAEPGTAQDAADSSRTQTGAPCDLVAGHVSPAKNNNLFPNKRTGLPRAVVRPRAAIGQARHPPTADTGPPIWLPSWHSH